MFKANFIHLAVPITKNFGTGIHLIVLIFILRFVNICFGIMILACVMWCLWLLWGGQFLSRKSLENREVRKLIGFLVNFKWGF